MFEKTRFYESVDRHNVYITVHDAVQHSIFVESPVLEVYTWAASWENLFCHMRTTKAQISLRICTVWSAPSLFAVRWYNTSSSYIQNFKPLANLCSRAGRFESYLVGNPEDRFSREEAHLKVLHVLNICYHQQSSIQCYHIVSFCNHIVFSPVCHLYKCSYFSCSGVIFCIKIRKIISVSNSIRYYIVTRERSFYAIKLWNATTGTLCWIFINILPIIICTVLISLYEAYLTLCAIV